MRFASAFGRCVPPIACIRANLCFTFARIDAVASKGQTIGRREKLVPAGLNPSSRMIRHDLLSLYPAGALALPKLTLQTLRLERQDKDILLIFGSIIQIPNMPALSAAATSPAPARSAWRTVACSFWTSYISHASRNVQCGTETVRALCYGGHLLGAVMNPCPQAVSGDCV
jgi:hypothetical protein